MADLQQELPCSLQAEQSVLGAILTHPEKFSEVTAVLTENDFYFPRHQDMFAAMNMLSAKSKAIDVVTLIEEMRTKKAFANEDPTQYIRTVAEILPTAANLKDYVSIVKEKSLLRSIISVAENIKTKSFENNAPSDVLSYAESEIYDLSNGKTSHDLVPIAEALVSTFDNLTQLAQNPEASAGTPTDFKAIDNVLVGMGKGDMILIGARPGMGKTSFALNIATNVAKKSKKAVCIFSLEMSTEQLLTRIISSEAMIDSKKLRTGKIDKEDWDTIGSVCAELAETNIFIDDTAGISVSQIKSKVRRIKNLGLIVIDYLQLLQGERHADNRVLEVGDISRNIKLMAKELGIPVICCAQLSRNNEQRNKGDRRPVLSDLRDSGSIEQDADVVMFLYRGDEVPEEPTARSEVECIFAKNRHGETGTVKLGWVGQFTKFTEIEQKFGEPS